MTIRERRELSAANGIDRSATRRTVTRGLAWTVPVVAVATTAPAFAVSPPPPPPPPSFDFANAYKNPGSSCDSACIPKQSYGVPVLVTNNSGEDYIIQFTTYYIGGTSSTGGVNRGVHSLTTKLAGCEKNFPSCTSPDTCPGYGLTSSNSVCIPSGTTDFRIYVTSGPNGSSPQGGQEIGYRWIKKTGCQVTFASAATSNVSPPNTAC